MRILLTFRLSDDVDERTAATAAAATDFDEVFGVGDDVDDGDDDGEPVRCLRRANALLSPSVLPCNLCTFTINVFFGVVVLFIAATPLQIHKLK